MRYFMTLLFVLLAYAVFAQNDPKAKEILDKAAAKFKAYPAAEIDFTLTMENPSENIHEMHEGKAWMKGNLYKLNVMDVENYYDGRFCPCSASSRNTARWPTARCSTSSTWVSAWL